jgi:hypothetical protein
MSHFIRNGDTYRVSSERALDIVKTLPVGNYKICQDALGNLFLQNIEPYVPNTKYYGDVLKNTDRILNTFLDRKSGSTGVLLFGEKGSGKTLLSKNLSIQAAAKYGIPTITISEPWVGEKFNQFIQSIDQPAIVLFDEFEKVYNQRELQEGLLTLLDGVYPTQKMFVLTTNDAWAVNDYMRNRPGRIFYSIEYKGLDEAFVREYCVDVLKNQDHTNSVVTYSKMFNEFNFDMLKALVEDMNRYNETAADVIRLLNAKPENDRYGGSTYEAVLMYKGFEVAEFSPTTVSGSPLARSWTFEAPDVVVLKLNPEDKKLYAVLQPGQEKDKFFYEDGTPIMGWDAAFEPNDIVMMTKDGVYRYTNEEGFELVLTKQAEKAKFDYTSLL